MLEAVYKEIREHMHKSVEAVSREFAAVRTGKASIHLLDTIRVEAYETMMPLNQLATVTAPESRLLAIQVFDKSTVGHVVKAIQVADLGLNPVVDGQMIRIPIPPLTEERRRELVKHCKQITEDGRVAARNIRREANERLKKMQKDKKISEDQEADGHDEVQKITDEAIKEMENLLAAKEKEVMEI